MDTVIVLASGPSTTQSDIDTINASRLPIIATNCMYQYVEPYIIYMADYRFCNLYKDKLPEDVIKYTTSKRAATEFGYKNFPEKAAHNSGNSALKLAASLGFKKIIAVGIDCSGSSHFHGDHADGLRNPAERQFISWRKLFTETAALMAGQGVEVINASRHTSLTCFPRMSLDDALSHNWVGSFSEELQPA